MLLVEGVGPRSGPGDRNLGRSFGHLLDRGASLGARRRDLPSSDRSHHRPARRGSAADRYRGGCHLHRRQPAGDLGSGPRGRGDGIAPPAPAPGPPGPPRRQPPPPRRVAGSRSLCKARWHERFSSSGSPARGAGASRCACSRWWSPLGCSAHRGYASSLAWVSDDRAAPQSVPPGAGLPGDPHRDRRPRPVHSARVRCGAATMGRLVPRPLWLAVGVISLYLRRRRRGDQPAPAVAELPALALRALGCVRAVAAGVDPQPGRGKRHPIPSGWTSSTPPAAACGHHLFPAAPGAAKRGGAGAAPRGARGTSGLDPPEPGAAVTVTMLTSGPGFPAGAGAMVEPPAAPQYPAIPGGADHGARALGGAGVRWSRFPGRPQCARSPTVAAVRRWCWPTVPRVSP